MLEWRSFLLIVFLFAAQFTATVDFASAQSAPSLRENIAELKSARKSQRPVRIDRAARLKSLYEALAKAPNAQIAKLVEAKIDALNARSGSDTVDLLMMRARVIMQAKDNKLAFELLNAAIDIAPNFVDARVQRATLYYLTKDYGSALADLRIVLAKEPRHYGAYAGLGVILQDMGEDKRALEAFRRALLIHPYMDSVSETVKKLTIKVEGRDI
jgi:tetratricopeptide (TPR) repeat protein